MACVLLQPTTRLTYLVKVDMILGTWPSRLVGVELFQVNMNSGDKRCGVNFRGDTGLQQAIINKMTTLISQC